LLEDIGIVEVLLVTVELSLKLLKISIAEFLTWPDMPLRDRRWHKAEETDRDRHRMNDSHRHTAREVQGTVTVADVGGEEPVDTHWPLTTIEY
jgi:hypothetical protein